jgi:hypothetical protein
MANDRLFDGATSAQSFGEHPEFCSWKNDACTLWITVIHSSYVQRALHIGPADVLPPAPLSLNSDMHVCCLVSRRSVMSAHTVPSEDDSDTATSASALGDTRSAAPPEPMRAAPTGAVRPTPRRIRSLELQLARANGAAAPRMKRCTNCHRPERICNEDDECDRCDKFLSGECDYAKGMRRPAQRQRIVHDTTSPAAVLQDIPTKPERRRLQRSRPNSLKPSA